MRHRYTGEEKVWLKENASSFPAVSKLAEAFNTRFCAAVSSASIRQQCVNRLGISFGKPQRAYTLEENEFLREHYGKLTFQQLAAELSHRFGHQTTWTGVRSHMYLALGLTLDNPSVFSYQWKRQPLGAERIINGYIWVKVADEKGRRGSHNAYRNNWKMKQRIVWEEHNGPVPEDCQIVFLDGNSLNCAPNNLYCLKKRFLAIMRANHWWTEFPDLTLTAIKYVELHYALIDRNDETGGKTCE